MNDLSQAVSVSQALQDRPCIWVGSSNLLKMPVPTMFSLYDGRAGRKGCRFTDEEQRGVTREDRRSGKHDTVVPAFSLHKPS